MCSHATQYHIDNLVLVETIVIAPEFLSAEPLASNVVAVTTKGEVDLSAVSVSLNGSVSSLFSLSVVLESDAALQPVTIKGHNSYVPVDTPGRSITYFTLAKNLAPGKLVITAGEKSFNHTLPNVLYGRYVHRDRS